MHILLIDNFDSFTYNLAQFLGELGASLDVVRNNAITFEEIRKLQPDGIVISPGPCTPNEAGISLPLVSELAGEFPILGVCLGHQSIGQAFGGKVIRAPELMHGKRSPIHHQGTSVFRELPSPFMATRYHSLIVERESLPECLEITAQTEDQTIMGLQHRDLPVTGIQFHPESFITEHGKTMLKNFLDTCRNWKTRPAEKKNAVKSQGTSSDGTKIMIQFALKKIIDGKHLTREEANQTMHGIMSGQATDAQIGAFLVGLRMKGEQAQEIAGFAESMRSHARKVVYKGKTPAVDIVGTGGDGKHTINISTLAAFVVAGAGAPVAKHGNRSVSSKCGSADVLTEMGVNIELNNEQMSACLEAVGIAFLFAPMLHPAMKHAIGPRRAIGVRSVFNILGPITNPAGVKHQLIGVYDRVLAPLLADVLRQLDSERILIVHSADGMDEISLADKTYVTELKDGKIRDYEVDPTTFGLSFNKGNITGGDAPENAAIGRRLLEGEKGAGRDIVVANAAACLYSAGFAEDFLSAAELAAKSIDDGHALAKLDALAQFTQQFA